MAGLAACADTLHGDSSLATSSRERWTGLQHSSPFCSTGGCGRAWSTAFVSLCTSRGLWHISALVPWDLQQGLWIWEVRGVLVETGERVRGMVVGGGGMAPCYGSGFDGIEIEG